MMQVLGYRLEAINSLQPRRYEPSTSHYRALTSFAIWHQVRIWDNIRHRFVLRPPSFATMEILEQWDQQLKNIQALMEMAEKRRAGKKDDDDVSASVIFRGSHVDRFLSEC